MHEQIFQKKKKTHILKLVTNLNCRDYRVKLFKVLRTSLFCYKSDTGTNQNTSCVESIWFKISNEKTKRRCIDVVSNGRCRYNSALIFDFSNMNGRRLTNAELTDVIFVDGFCYYNSLAATQEYRLHYPNRRQSSREVFVNVHC